jgi:hypothetical protein
VSGMFDQPDRPQPPQQEPPQRSGRSRALIITAGVLVGLFILLTGFSTFWTERLWFDSVGYSGVFSTLLWTRIGLFLVFGGLMAAASGRSSSTPPPRTATSSATATPSPRSWAGCSPASHC